MLEHELKAIEKRYGGSMSVLKLVTEVRRLRDANCDLMDKLEAATGGEDDPGTAPATPTDLF